MLFAVTRVVGVWYWVSVLCVYSVSVWTVVWSGAMCVFSVCALLVYVWTSEGVSIATTAVERRTDTSKAR